jgi:autotransporter-associated beta strand protein
VSTNTLAAIVGDQAAGNATSLTKSGVGQWVLTGNNTFSGVVTVSGGTLKLAAATGFALGNVSSMVVNSGGTLLLGANNQINGGAIGTVAANMTLAGGTFATGGFSQAASTLGTLTLNGDSTIDLGAAASVVHFGGSSGQAWSAPGSYLYVTNWNGTVGSGGGTDQLIFGSTSGGLTTGQVQQIIFVNPNGLTGNYFGQMLSTGEVVAFRPVPEPATVVAGWALAGLVGWWEVRRRRQGKRQSLNGSDVLEE